MQTFLPYKDFLKTSKSLDRQRLGKQRVECLQILQCLLEKETRWRNHPAVKMWKGYENCLVIYGIAICQEWINRDYKDNCLNKIKAFYNSYKSLEFPEFIGNEEFHRSHQSNLIRKNPEYYQQFFFGIPDNLEYVWPVK